MTVRITHPFPGHPEYTGFDVKGIIIFDGSYEIDHEYNPFWPWYPPCIISWKELGDPEVLNADGYTPRWRPGYDIGSDLPVLNYWEGKYAKGEPDAIINAYLNFYSIENRHIFLSDDTISRVYTIWLPPGEPVVAVYAVEACWEPPLVMPVSDPVTDFPITANQPEAYKFDVVINNGEPVTYQGDCCGYDLDCSDLRIEIKQWHGLEYNWITRFFENGVSSSDPLTDCEGVYLEFERPVIWQLGNSPIGIHRQFVIIDHYPPEDWNYNWAYGLSDFTVIE